MTIRRPQYALPARARGAALIELALVLTLLVTIVAGIIGFGRTFWHYDALSKATRNAARTLSVSAPATLASVGAVNAAAEVRDAAASAGIDGFNTSNVLVRCLDASMNTIACVDGSAPAGVRVSIQNYTLTLGNTIPFLLGGPSTYTLNLAPGTSMPYMR